METDPLAFLVYKWGDFSPAHVYLEEYTKTATSAIVATGTQSRRVAAALNMVYSMSTDIIRQEISHDMPTMAKEYRESFHEIRQGSFLISSTAANKVMAPYLRQLLAQRIAAALNYSHRMSIEELEQASDIITSVLK